jgi:hypothetical protein
LRFKNIQHQAQCLPTIWHLLLWHSVIALSFQSLVRSVGSFGLGDNDQQPCSGRILESPWTHHQ